MRNRMMCMLAGLLVLTCSAETNVYNFLVGTYTSSGKSKGVYAYTADMNTGTFVLKGVAEGLANPSFVAITPDKKFVYAVEESEKGSAAVALKFDAAEGTFRLLNRELTRSAGPCHIAVTPRHVFTANYTGGSVSVFERKADGGISELKQLVAHSGHSIVADRQGEPHVHQIILTPDKRRVIATDLGTDELISYAYNPNAPADILTPVDTIAVKPGSGPRHAVLRADGRFMYLVQELDGTVTVLKRTNGQYKIVQQTTVALDAAKVNAGAEIALSADERFLYVTNRGTANTITTFRVGDDGRLTIIQQLPTGGEGPRSFAITPDGRYVFVAHQYTDAICVFRRNVRSGLLLNTGKVLAVGAPVCVVFY